MYVHMYLRTYWYANICIFTYIWMCFIRKYVPMYVRIIIIICFTGNSAVVAIVVVIVILILCGCIIMDILFYCSKRKEQHDQDNGVYLITAFNICTYVYCMFTYCTSIQCIRIYTYILESLNFCFVVHMYVRTYVCTHNNVIAHFTLF